MRINDIEREFSELFRDVRRKTKDVTVDYQGRSSNYITNRNKALVGIIGGFFLYPIIPIMGLVALGYGGVKAYQAYKDKDHDKEANQHVRRD